MIKLYETLSLPVLSYVCETFSFKLREVHWLRVFQIKMLRNEFGPERKGVTGNRRNLHNKVALFTKYHPEIKSGMTGGGHVACMERREIHSVLKGKSKSS
jgi:hypothetical protein